MPGLGSESAAVLSVQSARAGATATSLRDVHVAVTPFSGGTDTAGGLLAWANPESASIIVTGCYLDVTTIASGACTVDVGEASNGTTKNKALIDTLDVHSATGLFNSIDDHGSTGKTKVIVPQGAFITVSTESGASAGLVGNLIIQYILR